MNTTLELLFLERTDIQIILVVYIYVDLLYFSSNLENGNTTNEFSTHFFNSILLINTLSNDVSIELNILRNKAVLLFIFTPKGIGATVFN